MSLQQAHASLGKVFTSPNSHGFLLGNGWVSKALNNSQGTFFLSSFHPGLHQKLWPDNLSDLHLLHHLHSQTTYVIITSENSRGMIFRKDFMCTTSKYSGGITFVILAFRMVTLRELIQYCFASRLEKKLGDIVKANQGNPQMGPHPLRVVS